MTNSIQAAQAIIGSSRLPSSADFQPNRRGSEAALATVMGAITTDKNPATFTSISNALLAQSIPVPLSAPALSSSLNSFASNLFLTLPGEQLLSVRQALADLTQTVLQELNRLAQVPQTPQSLAGAWRGPQGIASLNDPALARELAGLTSRFSSPNAASFQGQRPLEPLQQGGMLDQALAVSSVREVATSVGGAETLDASFAARITQPQNPSALIPPPVPRESNPSPRGEQLRQPPRPLPPANRNETSAPKQRQRSTPSGAEKLLESMAQLLKLGGQMIARAFGY